MTAATVLSELRARGVELLATPDRLRWRPRSAVTPELRAALEAHAREILELLRPPRPLTISERAAILRSQKRPDDLPASGVQLFPAVRPLPIVNPAACWSCGEELDGAARGRRCTACDEAYAQIGIGPVLLAAPLRADIEPIDELPSPLEAER